MLRLTQNKRFDLRKKAPSPEGFVEEQAQSWQLRLKKNVAQGVRGPIKLTHRKVAHKRDHAVPAKTPENHNHVQNSRRGQEEE